MVAAAEALDFETAARLRDQVVKLRTEVERTHRRRGALAPEAGRAQGELVRWRTEAQALRGPPRSGVAATAGIPRLWPYLAVRDGDVVRRGADGRRGSERLHELREADLVAVRCPLWSPSDVVVSFTVALGLTDSVRSLGLSLTM